MTSMAIGTSRAAPVRVARALVLALVVGACAKAPPEPATGPAIADNEHEAVVPVGPTSVVAATLRHVADLGQPLTTQLAFGPQGRWWHWDGEQATAFIDGVAQSATLDATGFLAANPRVPADAPLAIGATLVTATGTRALHQQVVYALKSDQPPYGYEHTSARFSADGALLVITQKWRPSRCCRDEESRPDPPHLIAQLYDTATGTHREEIGVQAPVMIGRERLLLSGRRALLHNREPLYPLNSETFEYYRSEALALGVDESVIAAVKTAQTPRLALYRARDGVALHEWEGPPGATALAFHPKHPLLAVAGDEVLQVWRVDGTVPTRLAEAHIGAAPDAIVFHPEGHRLVLTGRHGALFDLVLDAAPADDGPAALATALARHDPSIPPLRAGTRVVALSVDDDRVHAYGISGGLYTFDRADGQRVRSWLREGDDTGGIAVARQAPVFAVAERTPRAEEKRSRRVDLIDARTYAVSATAFVADGKLANLVLSPRGTALAWSLEGDHVVHLVEPSGPARLQLSANSTGVEAIAISPDDTRLAVANRHVTDNIFVGTVGTTTALAITTDRGVSQLLFSHDGKRLFVVDFDGKIRVVDASTGRALGTFDPKAGSSGTLVESPDGRHLAYARHAVVVLDAITGAEIARFAVTAQVEALAIAPAGDVLAVGDTLGDIRLLAWP